MLGIAGPTAHALASKKAMIIILPEKMDRSKTILRTAANWQASEGPVLPSRPTGFR